MTVFPKQPETHPLPNTQHLLAHGAGSPLAGIGLAGLGLGDALGEDSGILVLHDRSAIVPGA